MGPRLRRARAMVAKISIDNSISSGNSLVFSRTRSGASKGSIASASKGSITALSELSENNDDDEEASHVSSLVEDEQRDDNVENSTRGRSRSRVTNVVAKKKRSAFDNSLTITPQASPTSGSCIARSRTMVPTKMSDRHPHHNNAAHYNYVLQDGRSGPTSEQQQHAGPCSEHSTGQSSCTTDHSSHQSHGGQHYEHSMTENSTQRSEFDATHTMDTIHDSFESYDTMDSKCIAACDQVGRLLGLAVRGAMKGLNEVLEYSDEMCNQGCNPNAYTNSNGGGIAAGGMVTSPPTDVIASTPHPMEENSVFSEKMDELLKVLNESQANTDGEDADSKPLSKDELLKIFRDMKAQAPQAQKQQQVHLSENNTTNSNTATDESKDDNPMIYDQSLLAMVKIVDPLKNLNESAISKDHSVSVQGDGSHFPGFSIPSSKEDAKNMKAGPDYHMTLESATSGNRDDVDNDIKNTSFGQQSNVSSMHEGSYEVSKEPEEQSSANQNVMVETKKHNGNVAGSSATWKIHNDGPDDMNTPTVCNKTRGAAASTTKSSHTKPPLGIINNNTPKTRSGKGGRNKMKKMLNDIKIPRSVKIKDKTKAKKVSSNTPKKKQQQPSTKAEASPQSIPSMNEPDFVADFASNNVNLDSMGFPNTPTADDNADHPSWESSFIEDYPFNNPSDHVGGQAAVTAATKIETRTCAYCRKGGSEATALKLCSACQTTYYCSHQCQSIDWINGHSKACKPIQ